MTAPFEDFLEVFKKMTPDHKKRLIKAHKEYGRLKLLCEAKGYIELLPNLQGIKVLKKEKEVDELRKVIDFLQPGHFKWIDGTKKKKKEKGNQKLGDKKNGAEV